LLGLCIVSWFMMLRSKLKPVTALLFSLIVPLIAFSFNIYRILFLVLLRDHGLEKYTVDFWHGLTGITVFLLGLLTVNALIKFARSYSMSLKPVY
jgi:exosortase/archaeosortase family protein